MNVVQDFTAAKQVIAKFLREIGAGYAEHNAGAILARLAENELLCVRSRDFHDGDRVQQLESLVSAVSSSEFEGIYCETVGGKNWFDARAAVMASR